MLPGSSVRACWLAYDALRMATIVADKLFPRVPARTRRSSCCRCFCREAQSERASSLMTHFAWPALLPRSLFQACLLALGGHPAAKAASGGSFQARGLAYDSLRMASIVTKRLTPSVPARTRRSSRGRCCCREAQSERAGSLPARIVLLRKVGRGWPRGWRG